MDKIVDHLFVFKGEGQVENFPGNYSDYRTYESSKILEERETKNNIKKAEKNNWKEKDTSNKLSFNEQKEYNRLEKEIQKLEEQKGKLQTKFADESLSGEEINLLSIELGELDAKIEEKTERWFELGSMLEG
jgi:ATP-binding cassette subfamily F protein uup